MFNTDENCGVLPTAARLRPVKSMILIQGRFFGGFFTFSPTSPHSVVMYCLTFGRTHHAVTFGFHSEASYPSLLNLLVQLIPTWCYFLFMLYQHLQSHRGLPHTHCCVCHTLYKGEGPASMSYLCFMGPVVVMENDQTVKIHTSG